MAEDSSKRDVEDERMRAAVRSELFGDAPGEPLKIGRFKVLSRLGAGGMGVVYSSFDEELDRRVAIKVLRKDLHGGTQGRTRLLREAQALAKLSHPNVVQVYEVGQHDEQVFIAMEFVKGMDAREWLEAGERSWREVLDCYLEAGTGLQAAHGAGLVHRDFKPDNMIVARDGRVRVLDFGLARPEAAPTAKHEALAETEMPRSSPSPMESPLTQTGMVMGTPAYMSAEQHLGLPADARSDQFSFCVSLYEALYGERPFKGDTRAKLKGAVTRGELRPVPRGSKVPGWIRKVLARGLEANPAARYSSMAGLLDELRDDPAVRTRRRLIGAGVVVAIGGAGAFGYLQARPAFESRCAPVEERLAGVWDDATRAKIAARFVDPNQPHVADSWTSLERELDAWTERWSGLYQRACTEVGASGANASALEVQRLTCLEQRHQFLAVIVDILETNDPFAVANGYMGHFLSPWSDLDTCESDAAVRSQPPPPDDPGTRAGVADVRPEIVLGVVAGAVAPKQALAILESAAGKTAELGHPAAHAEALWALGGQQSVLELESATATLEEGLVQAESGRHDIVAALILRGLLGLAQRRGDEDAARSLRRRLEAAIDRSGVPPHLEFMRLELQAADAEAAADKTKAHQLEETMLAHTEEHHGERSALAGLAHWDLARSAQDNLDDFQESLVLSRRAVEILEENLGNHHPVLCGPIDWNGHALGMMKRWDEGLREYERVVEIMARVYPEGHPRLGWVLFKISENRMNQGQELEAIKAAEQAEAMLSKTLGPDHSETLRGATSTLAMHRALVGDYAGAKEPLDRLIASEHIPELVRCQSLLVRTAAHAQSRDVDAMRADRDQSDACFERATSGARDTRADPISDSYVPVVQGMWGARAEAELGNVEQARALAERALEVVNGANDIEAWQVRQLETLVGRLRLRADDPKGARALLEPSSAEIDQCCDQRFFAADARFVLAQALSQTGGDRARAVELARRAAAGYEAFGRKPEHERVQAWLSKHARSP